MSIQQALSWTHSLALLLSIVTAQNCQETSTAFFLFTKYQFVLCLEEVNSLANDAQNDYPLGGVWSLSLPY